jgi:hypothetical protein
LACIDTSAGCELPWYGERHLADPPPTSTALQVSGFAVPGALIEIEAKAVARSPTAFSGWPAPAASSAGPA